MPRQDVVNGVLVFIGFIPEKFGTQEIIIDAAHPLAYRVVDSPVPPRDKPVLRIVGGEYDGQIVDLNDHSLDYALGQLGGRYCLDEVDGETAIVFVPPVPTTVAEDIAAANGSAPVIDPVLASLPDPIIVDEPAHALTRVEARGEAAAPARGRRK